jgi:hypothetical protein
MPIFVGTAQRMGCLEFRVYPSRHPTVPREFVVLQYELGNRCNVPVRVDLTAVRVQFFCTEPLQWSS